MAYGTLAVLYIDVRRVNGEKKHRGNEKRKFNPEVIGTGLHLQLQRPGH
jgi:hypothetical protein